MGWGEVGWDGVRWDVMGWDGVGSRVLCIWDGMGLDGTGLDGMGWNGKWDGMEWDGWNGMGWHGIGWDGMVSLQDLPSSPLDDIPATNSCRPRTRSECRELAATGAGCRMDC